jgi:hypothetical protein
MTILLWLVGLLAALAAGALAVGGVNLVGDAATYLRRRGLRADRPRRALRQYRPARPDEQVTLPPVVWAILAVLRRPSPLLIVPPVGSMVVAIISRDPLLSPYLVLLGLGLAVYLAYRQTLHARQGIGDEVLRLVDAYVGLYRVNPTTFATLELAQTHLKAGPVRAAVEQAVRQYGATRNARGALQKLLAVRDPCLVRFTLVLDQAGEQGAAEIQRLLADLRERLRRRWTMRLAAQGVFASLRGTLAVLVGVAAVATVVGVTLLLWRDIHTHSVTSRLVFMALTAMAFLAAGFFDRRMRLDEETFL